MEMAPQVGLEPTTPRLTAECSAIELLRNIGAQRRTTRLARTSFITNAVFGGQDEHLKAHASSLVFTFASFLSTFDLMPIRQWKLARRSLPYGERTLVMGVLNVTPDSF